MCDWVYDAIVLVNDCSGSCIDKHHCLQQGAAGIYGRGEERGELVGREI